MPCAHPTHPACPRMPSCRLQRRRSLVAAQLHAQHPGVVSEDAHGEGAHPGADGGGQGDVGGGHAGVVARAGAGEDDGVEEHGEDGDQEEDQPRAALAVDGAAALLDAELRRGGGGGGADWLMGGNACVGYLAGATGPCRRKCGQPLGSNSNGSTHLPLEPAPEGAVRGGRRQLEVVKHAHDGWVGGSPGPAGGVDDGWRRAAGGRGGCGRAAGAAAAAAVQRCSVQGAGRRRVRALATAGWAGAFADLRPTPRGGWPGVQVATLCRAIMR